MAIKGKPFLPLLKAASKLVLNILLT